MLFTRSICSPAVWRFLRQKNNPESNRNGSIRYADTADFSAIKFGGYLWKRFLSEVSLEVISQRAAVGDVLFQLLSQVGEQLHSLTVELIESAV